MEAAVNGTADAWRERIVGIAINTKRMALHKNQAMSLSKCIDSHANEGDSARF